jgi:hypothetical protein
LSGAPHPRAPHPRAGARRPRLEGGPSSSTTITASAVLLIDEYDPPIHAGDAHGSCDQAVELFRNLLSGGYLTATHVE